MNASHILDALETIDDKYIVEAKERSFINITKSSRSMKRMQTLVALIAALLLLCGPVRLVRSVAAKAVSRPGTNRPKRD
mgnify:CR=1 FL=1